MFIEEGGKEEVWEREERYSCKCVLICSVYDNSNDNNDNDSNNDIKQ